MVTRVRELGAVLQRARPRGGTARGRIAEGGELLLKGHMFPLHHGGLLQSRQPVTTSMNNIQPSGYDDTQSVKSGLNP